MIVIRPSSICCSRSNNSITSLPFTVLVANLKKLNKKCTVIESSCGGLINASIMAVPGSSQVYYGGSVAYNTKHSLKLLLNDSKLHNNLLESSSKTMTTTTPLYNNNNNNNNQEEEEYIQSKLASTKQTAIAFCEQLNVDYAIAEGGATGPTFRPKGMKTGFAVLAIAGRRRSTTTTDEELQSQSQPKVELLAQTIIRSTHADREVNMRLFADAAATLAVETILGTATATVGTDVDTSKESSSSSSDDDDDETDRLFLHSWLDRATHLRSQSDCLKELEQRSTAKCIVLRNATECLLLLEDGDDVSTRLALVKNDTVEPTVPRTFLGLLRPKIETSHITCIEEVQDDAIPLFGISIENNNNNNSQLISLFDVPTGTGFQNTRTHAPLLVSDLQREVVFYATAMAQWKRTHLYCSSCGSPLIPIQGGTCLKCTNNNNNCSSRLWWPRQDPSIIVLVTNRTGDKVLLARSKRHPAKVHTALAGFVEAGETMEDAVIRETLEETGVRIDKDSITYIASQPWPFPRSTMMAFRATANDDPNVMPIQIDENELVSASWFDKIDVAAAAQIPGAVMDPTVAQQVLEQDPTLKVLIPPQGVVARTLMEHWLEDPLLSQVL